MVDEIKCFEIMKFQSRNLYKECNKNLIKKLEREASMKTSSCKNNCLTAKNYLKKHKYISFVRIGISIVAYSSVWYSYTQVYTCICWITLTLTGSRERNELTISDL